jgi:hypothetical protein
MKNVTLFAPITRRPAGQQKRKKEKDLSIYSLCDIVFNELGNRMERSLEKEINPGWKPVT